MRRLKSLLIYCGLSKDAYNKIRSRVSADNRKMVGTYSFMAAIFFVITAINTAFNHKNIPSYIYLIPAILLAFIWFINKHVGKKKPIVSDIFAVSFVIILMGTGVYLGVTQCAERTTALLPFFAFASVLFCFRIIYLVVILLGTEVVYILLIYPLQTTELFNINLANTFIFCLIGICVGSFLMLSKYRKHAIDYNNQFLLEKDPLTNVFNRFSYDRELDDIMQKKETVTICAFDINGLKTCNDTKGHKAGDELIKGAADCISLSFGYYGKVFRTGGDEFVAILRNKEVDTKELKKRFHSFTDSWHGKLNDRLSVSCGIALMEASTHSDLSNTLQKADKLMYEEKEQYYQETGIRR